MKLFAKACGRRLISFIQSSHRSIAKDEQVKIKMVKGH